MKKYNQIPSPVYLQQSNKGQIDVINRNILRVHIPQLQ